MDYGFFLIIFLQLFEVATQNVNHDFDKIHKGVFRQWNFRFRFANYLKKRFVSKKQIF